TGTGTSTLVAPTITTQPTNQTVTAGQTATFTVVAAGTAPLSYQWQKNAANIAGATAASYTTPVTTTSDSGSTFAVVVSNTAGTVTSATATLTVNAAPVAPTITTQPTNQTVTAGQTATFTVVAAGTAPLSYQWQKNAANIAGATAASYTTPVTTTSDSGSTFAVVVSNTAGTVTSATATLTVNAAPVAPTITTQPTNQTVTAGQTATFTVVAAGTAPLSYQWQKNAANIAGATAASYTTPVTTTSDSGSTFAVVVSNTAGTVTSATATLTVNAASGGASISYLSASGTNCDQPTASAGVACTLAASTATGNDVIVGLSWEPTTQSINNVVGSASGSYFVPYAENCSASSCSAVLVCLNCSALTSVTPTFSGTTFYELNVAEYSGVTWMGITGINTATSTNPGLSTSTVPSFVTGDPNDFVVVETSSLGSAGLPAADTGHGNLRQANRTGATSGNVAGALCDNTAASAGSIDCLVTIASASWAAAGVELRTTAPKTYIWPDCDSTHPCLIYHYGRPALPLEPDGPLFKFWVRPSLASNLLVLTITHPGTISSIVDAKSNTWASGPSAAGNYTTDVRYVCGAPAGSGGEIDITLNAAIGVSDIM